MKVFKIRDIRNSEKNETIPENAYPPMEPKNSGIEWIRRSRSNIKLSILFDIGLKSLLLIPTIYLLFHYPDHPSVFTLVASLTGILIFLIVYQTYILSKYMKIKETDSIIEKLKKKYNFYSGAYQRFLFTGSLSSPLFVMTGFLIYLHLRYGGIDLAEKFGDVILFTIIIFAWILSLIFQIPVYLFEMKELKSEIIDLDDSSWQIINLTKDDRARNRRSILFIVFIFAGIMALWLVYRLTRS